MTTAGGYSTTHSSSSHVSRCSAAGGVLRATGRASRRARSDPATAGGLAGEMAHSANWPSLARFCLRQGLKYRYSIDCRIFRSYTNQAVIPETKDVISSHLETASLGFRAPRSDCETEVGDKGHGGAPGYLSLTDDAVDLLEQTRAFSRAVNQLQADMEQSIGRPTSPARHVV